MANEEHPLHKVFLKVLEDWAMMLVEESTAETHIFESDQKLYKSHVHMRGAFEGTISIIAPESFLNTLTNNLLGGDEEETPDEENLKDAFREMGNVLAGNFLTEAYGSEITFDVLAPEVTEVSYDELKKLIKAPQAYFAIADDAPVCATFTVGREYVD